MNYLITGVAGTGKSSICKKLRERGYTSHDIDDVPGLCSWRNKKTGELGDYHPGIGREWIDQHDWVCSEAKLSNLLTDTGDKKIVCGIVSNQKELLHLFEKVILLTLDDNLLKQRLSSRKGKYDFAKTESEQLRILDWKGDWEKEMIQAGATRIDTNKPLDEIVEKIITLVS